jgi:peroxiredoxin
MRILCLLLLAAVCAQSQPDAFAERIRGLRQLPDEVRARATRDLALEIRRLPATPKKVSLATGLANLATEGDFGHDTLQEVAETLAGALKEQPAPSAAPYSTLAQLVRYEHVRVSLEAQQFAAAMSALEAAERRRQGADFTLVDLEGKAWTLSKVRGKVVLVNFWATWCPPCRKEMPDLEALYNQFKGAGLVVLAISDDDADKVRRFVEERHFTFPVLLDPGGKANQRFEIEGIPKSFVYDRSGALVAQAIDMRTRKQFLKMLAQAGLPAEEDR